MSIEEQLSIEEAKAIMQGGLAQVELELVTSFCAPLYWALPYDAGGIRTRNGTAFFLDAGFGVFGVTANHVIEGWKASRLSGAAGSLLLGSNGVPLLLDWDARQIDAHVEIDIATFRVTADEVARLGKVVLTGSQTQWPPNPPVVQCGIYYSGYPGQATRYPRSDEVIFGAAPGGGIATSVSELDVSTMLERENMLPVLGRGLPPENFDFRGLSGGPMLTVVQNGLRSWRLAGVIYQGPNADQDGNEAILGMEVIRARRADFLLADGTLDASRWGALNISRQLPR